MLVTTSLESYFIRTSDSPPHDAIKMAHMLSTWLATVVVGVGGGGSIAREKILYNKKGLLLLLKQLG